MLHRANSRIGASFEIQKNAWRGKNVKASSRTFIRGATIEDEVFVGHNGVVINDKYPRATIQRGVPQLAGLRMKLPNWDITHGHLERT